MDIQTVICPLLHNLSEQTNYGQIVQIDCFRFVVKQAVCSDGYTTKHLVRDTLRPDKTADNLPYEKVGNNEPVCIADEVPFEIPDGWEWVRISSIAALVTKGTTPRGGNVAYSDDGIGFLRAENVAGLDRLDLSKLNHIDEATHTGFLKRSILEADDMLITIAGTLGRTAIVKEENLPLNANQAVAIIRLADSYSIDLRYLVYALNAPAIQDKLTAQKKITAIPNLTLEIISDCLVPIPPLNEQRRIVNQFALFVPQLSEYEDKQTELNALNASFPETLKKSILQEAVQGKLVPQDPNDEPASVLLERIRAEKQALIKAGKIKKDKNESVIFRRDNSHYEKRGSEEVCIDDEIPFEIPDTWEWCRLGNILTKLTDGTHSTPKYTNTGIPFISVKDISSGKLNFNDCKYISIDEHQELYSRCNPELNDILLTKVGTTGIPVIVDTEKQFSLFVSVALLKFNNELIFNKYVVQLINSPLVQKQVIKNTRGVGNKNWVMRDIANTLIAIPPSNEQHRIVAKLDEYFILINQI